mgnify:CR=1 FL=1
MVDNKVKDTVISIKNLHVHYVTEDEIYRAVNGLNLEILKGEVVGLVGETALSCFVTTKPFLGSLEKRGQVKQLRHCLLCSWYRIRPE